MTALVSIDCHSGEFISTIASFHVFAKTDFKEDEQDLTQRKLIKVKFELKVRIEKNIYIGN